jgi:hypothetical protein
MRAFLRAGVVLAVLCSAVMAASPAAAIKRCPSLPVTALDACVCTVANYATINDTGVTITIYNGDGIVANQCTPSFIPAKGGRSCFAGFEEVDLCGCEVTGEGGAARVSFSVLDAAGTSASASVECR